MLHNFARSLEAHHEYETEYMKILFYDLKKDYKGTYKSYEYHRICTILEGSKHVNINAGKTFDYTTSEFILLPPDSSVEMEITEDTKAVVYEISDKLLEDTKKHIQNKYNTEIIDEGYEDISSHILKSIESPVKRIKDACLSNDPNKAFLIDLYSQELTYSLIKNNYLPKDYNENLHDPINYTINYLKGHPTDNICIQELALLLNMSASNLSYRFKQKTGFTPKEFHNIIKLKKSLEYLKTQSVTEVSYSLGYENISYFINLFKKYYGVTPKQYALSKIRD